MRSCALLFSLLAITAVGFAVPTAGHAADQSPALKLSDPSDSSPPLQGMDEVIIRLSEEEKTGKVTLASKNRPWSIAIEAPIDKDTKRSDLIDLAGFSNAVSIQAGFTKRFLGSQKQKLGIAYSAAKLDICQLYADSLSAPEKKRLLDKAEKDTRLKHLFEQGEPDVKEVVEGHCAVDDEENDFYNDALSFAAKAQINDSDHKILKRLDAALQKFTTPLMNFRAKLGVKDFSYVVRDESTATGFSKKRTERQEPWSLEVSAGQLWTGGWNARRGRQAPDKIVWLTYQRSRSYKDAKSAEVCTELDGPEVLNCQDAAFGLPVEKDQELLIADFRSFLGKAGYSVKGFHDFEKSKFGARAEIYFLRDTKGRLTGGLGVEWQEDSDVKGSLFLTKGFSMGPDS